MNAKRPRQPLLKTNNVLGGYVELGDERFFKVSNSHLMDPFFMSLVSSSDHWVFVASNGALTAGRQNANTALFPYYSSDKIIDLVDSTGSTTIIQLQRGTAIINWEPFSNRGHQFEITQNVYKNGSGSKVILEEINHTEGLLFRYSWTTGERFGFIRNCTLTNLGNNRVNIRLLDGLQNIMPGGLASDFQLRFSNLGNAYKKNELLPDGRTGVYYLSSVPSDRAEPSEGLQATVVTQIGLDQPTILLSNQQLSDFRNGNSIKNEFETRAKAGCYLLCEHATLEAKNLKSWQIIANTNHDQTDVSNLQTTLQSPEITSLISDDISNNRNALLQIVSSCDGVQQGSNQLRNNRHLANTTFNAMRGGVPLDNYMVCTEDLKKHIEIHNSQVAEKHTDLFDGLPSTVHLDKIQDLIAGTENKNLQRICDEYLPFWFGRRHGDPTRPWNVFNIDVRKKNGQKRLYYEGNWRDIFQNWEALGVSFPQFLPAMLLRFVNASTADGYNPYRVTKNGFDWEAPDPDDPWANFGYWCDHQIIYQLKLLEWAHEFDPECLDGALQSNNCVYANVPYRIGDYENMLETPRSTITYDHELERNITNRVANCGADGKLVVGNLEDNSVESLVTVSLFEKLLLSGLTKLSNLIPEAGIWLNTQRPEWNDANNALVGNGTSVVTVCYLRRYFAFLSDWIAGKTQQFELSKEVCDFYSTISQTLSTINAENSLSDSSRREIVDAFQAAGSKYRQAIYNDGFSGKKSELSSDDFLAFANRSIKVLDQTISANRRDDCLYHAYNLVAFDDDKISIEHLGLMLEGQVAALSSQAVPAKEAIELLDALHSSDLYRSDQQSFMLYPNKDLGSFLDKNLVRADSVQQSALLTALVNADDRTILRRDNSGAYHFAGELKNSLDLKDSLDLLRNDSRFSELIATESESVCEMFEEVFQHRKFTGRSATFFAYEGLGSIYWHMVSKLVLAVQECYLASTDSNDSLLLKNHYDSIRDGLGLKKSPEVYGAIPTDPYSHTPGHQGAQQPGMTGQVKEDFLTRLIELGIRVEQGRLRFDTRLFDSSELCSSPTKMNFVGVDGNPSSIDLSAGQFGFTFCQVPIVYQAGPNKLTVHFANREPTLLNSLQLPERESKMVFQRTNEIVRIDVSVDLATKS